MHGAGRGVPQDCVAADQWANLAASQGHDNARQMRDNLADEITAASESPFEAAAEQVFFLKRLGGIRGYRCRIDANSTWVGAASLCGRCTL